MLCFRGWYLETNSNCRKEVLFLLLVLLRDLSKVGHVQDLSSACHYEAEEHKQCLPGLPARALLCPGSLG